ncbi:MAG: hypothetical protein AB7F86_16080, partial [Bdellovibrionales bacterium]
MHRKFHVLWLLALAVLSGCQPNDKGSKTIAERLMAGEILEFSEPGTRLPTCYRKANDWTDFRMGNEEREMYVLGAIQSGVGPGYAPCYRIGSNLTFGSVDKTKPFAAEAGVARVTKISLMREDLLSKSKLKGKAFASNDVYSKVTGSLKFRMKPDHHGIVYVVDVEYIKGSAADEKAIIDEDKQRRANPDFTETEADGDSLKSCQKPKQGKGWTEVMIKDEKMLEAVKEGRLASWPLIDKCPKFIQGQTVHLKRGLGDTFPSLGKFRIRKMKRFRADFADAKYFDFKSFDYRDLEGYIKSERARNPGEYMTVLDLEPSEGADTSVGDSGRQSPNKGTTAASCTKTLHMTHTILPSDNPIEIRSTDGDCLKDGDLAAVVEVSEHETI